MTNPIIPPAALNQHIACIGKTGSGKTYAMKGVVEHLLTLGRRVCVLDPTGAWWGMKSSADGKKPGFPVVIFGGDHADIPINEHAGTALGELIAAENMPSIIDLSGTTLGERHRFVERFAESIYRTNKKPLHLVIDEADEFAPQSGAPGTERMLGAIDRIVRRGRIKGFRVLMISQRPAVLNKNVLTQANTMIAMRIPASQDRKAVELWIKGQADEAVAENVMGSLAKLQRGEGWVWAPEQNHLELTRFPKITTFDSGRAPEDGEELAAPKSIADVDITGISKAMEAAIEESKANDPKELRKRIAELEQRIQADRAEINENAIDELKEANASLSVKLEEAEQARADAEEKQRELHGALVHAIAELRIAAEENQPGQRDAASLNGHAATPAPAKPRLIRAATAKQMNAEPPMDGITKRQQKFLDAAAALTRLRAEVNRNTVAAWTGVHPRGGSVGEELKALQDAGLITIDRGAIAVTEAGARAARPMNAREAIAAAASGLSPRQARVFEILKREYPKRVTREAIALEMGIHPRGGSFGEDIARLAGRGLIERARGELKARDFLFAR